MRGSEDSEERYLDLAGRIADGDEIDWDAELESASLDDDELARSLRKVAEVGRVHREGHPAVPETDTVPESIGEYRVRRLLGSGGLGIVYEAEEPGSGRLIALKVIQGARAQDPHALRLFEREARTLSRLHHPSIASLHESGCTGDGRHFIAMELARGRTLGEWRARRTTSPRTSASERQTRVALFREIAEAVAHAHEQGVIHRDLKPSNVLVLEEDARAERPSVKILDFGLARAAFLSGITKPGNIKGTLPYMSPEQARGDPDAIDRRTDVYSLGVILYELLTDSRPYELDQESFRDKIRAILTATPKRWGELWPSAEIEGSSLEPIPRRALEKEPARRYASVRDLIHDLDRHLERGSHPGEDVS